MDKTLVNNIIEATLLDKEELLIQEFNFEVQRENELLLFFKPECFLTEDIQHTRSIIEMSFQKFDEFKAIPCGTALLAGRCLDRLRIMDRHYGFINKMSRGGRELLSKEELKKIQESLDIQDLERFKIFGGHQFLENFSLFNEETLDKLWLTKKSVKLRSGLYTQKYKVGEEDIVLINGFHPSQLSHFTKPSRKIILVLLHSDTPWGQLKNHMVGNTFPEKANHGSIRGELYSNKNKYHLKDVSISNNFVHLSAGPFEALFEIDNFLKDLKVINFNINLTNIYRLMAEKGFKSKVVNRIISNPVAQVDHKEIDLFTFTEDRNTSEAIDLYSKYW